MSNPSDDAWHEQPQRFREALAFTASQTGFSPRLIEKDYYCTLVLQQLAPVFALGLVFKGGTALSKIHADFHRLSEDLDFAISIAAVSSRKQRRTVMAPLKAALRDTIRLANCFREIQTLAGSNDCAQYNAILSYRSCLTAEDEVLKLEIALREPLLVVPDAAHAKAILLNPQTRGEAVPATPVRVISRREAYAEKVRAALCRRDPAIRDFFDIDKAITTADLDLRDANFLKLVHQKLAVPGNERPSLDEQRLAALRRQVESQLRPVLREQDFSRFDLERVLRLLQNLDVFTL